MFGRCYSFFLILRSVFPEAEPWYSKTEGHVFTRIEDRFYDIRGLHLRAPKDIEPLDHQNGHKPHRWGKVDPRRLIDGAALQGEQQ